ncbi:MAG: oligoendopeptidase F [Candidatus Fimadaptatus sp.]
MDEIRTRAQIPDNYKWDMTALFQSNEAWEAEWGAVKAELEGLSALAGTLGEEESLLRALKSMFGLSRRLELLFVYANCRRDEDNGDSTYQRLSDMAMQLYQSFMRAVAFIEPELLSLSEDYMTAAMARDDFSDYRVYLKGVLRQRPHTLSRELETLMASTAEMRRAPDNIYSMMCDADMTFPTIKDAEGNDVEITHGNFIPLLESADREVRKNAWEGLMLTLGKWGNTISTTYSSSVKGDIFTARARKYADTLEAALYGNEIPRSVCDNLIKAVHGRFGAMERYIRLRGRLLGLETVRPYDMYTPIVGDVDMGLPYEEAYAEVVKSLSVMGREYTDQLRAAIDQRWIDVYENRGKTSGAYSTGAYGVHPYVLLNYQPTLDNRMTIAHEMGHAMHTWYSSGAQPYPTSDYSLFVAEVASTCNEMLVMRDLLKTTTDKRQRAYLLNHLLEQFRTTVFRQTQFAEFEMKTHAQAESGEPLTKDSLCALYEDLIRQYYPGMEVGDTVRYEWMRIPHFYRAYYVYQYATGFSAAVALSGQILEKGPEDYIRFLKLGSSVPPIEALKVAGVDMSTPDPVNQALDFFEQVLAEFEALMV